MNRHFVAWPAERGAGMALPEVPGGHEWDVWQRELARVAPLPFPHGG